VVEGNVEKIRRAQSEFNRGDVSGARSIVTEDVEWGTIGSFPGVNAVYHGRDALQEWMDSIRSAWEWFDVQVDEVVRAEEDLVVIREHLRGKGRSSGVEVEMRIYSVYWFEQGRIVKRRVFHSRQEALDTGLT
jgi:ketosteroid isomerase-like protein